MSEPTAQSAALPKREVWRISIEEAEPRCAQDLDALADETAVALEYNGLSHAVLLATPTDLEDLAIGFSYTEGIIRSASDIRAIDVRSADDGLILEIELASACLHALKLRRRSLAGRSGCGLCGLENLAEVRRPIDALSTRIGWLPAAAPARAIHALHERQPLHALTGATHAAGWADLQGDLLSVREDVGRHNALDKLIGHLLQHKDFDPDKGFAAISSRASFEMIQKAASAGFGALAAVSAPTRYAVELAQTLGLTLAAFARDARYTLYSHPEAVCLDVRHASHEHS